MQLSQALGLFATQRWIGREACPTPPNETLKADTRVKEARTLRSLCLKRTVGNHFT